MNKKIWQWAAIIAMSMMWGSSFILIKKSLIALTPYQSGALRMVFATLYFLPLALKYLKIIPLKKLPYFLIVGLIGNFFPAFMFAYGETHVSSALASMINSATPVFVFIFGIFFFNTKVSLLNLLGLLLGFAGAIILIIISRGSISAWNTGALLILVATMFYGFNTNYIKTVLKDVPPLAIPSLAFFLNGLPAVGSLFAAGIPDVSDTKVWLSISAVALLAFISSFLAVIIFNKVIKHTTAVFAATPTYLMPVVSIFWGLLDGEEIKIQHIFAVCIILFGVSLVNKTRKQEVLI